MERISKKYNDITELTAMLDVYSPSLDWFEHFVEIQYAYRSFYVEIADHQTTLQIGGGFLKPVFVQRQDKNVGGEYKFELDVVVGGELPFIIVESGQISTCFPGQLAAVFLTYIANLAAHVAVKDGWNPLNRRDFELKRTLPVTAKYRTSLRQRLERALSELGLELDESFVPWFHPGRVYESRTEFTKQLENYGASLANAGPDLYDTIEDRAVSVATAYIASACNSKKLSVPCGWV